MKLKIDIPTSCLLVSVEDAGPFITHLSKMQAIRETGWGKEANIEVVEERIKVEVVPDDLCTDERGGERIWWSEQAGEKRAG